jgi:hypothetical protein
MKSHVIEFHLGSELTGCASMPVCVVAQESNNSRQNTFNTTGSPTSARWRAERFSQPFFINRYGLVSGSSSLPDGTQHAALWLDGLKGDIGAPGLGGPNSIAFGDNERFQSAGEAETLLRIPTVKIFADSVPTSPVYLSCGRTGE